MEKSPDQFSLFADLQNGTGTWSYDAMQVLMVDSSIQMREWWQIFLSILLWMAVSYAAVYIIAAIMATAMLRKHPFSVFIIFPLIGMAVIGPATVGATTSAVLAFALTSANKPVSPIYCLTLGVTQTLIMVIVSFTRILATL